MPLFAFGTELYSVLLENRWNFYSPLFIGDCFGEFRGKVTEFD